MATALNPLIPLQVPRETLRPPSSDSPRTGLAMSVLAHALLVAGLTLGVQWRTNDEPAGVEAELWSAVPQLAAPRAEPPTPEPQPQPTPPTPAPPPPAPEPVRKAPPPPPQPTAAEREAEIATERAERLRREKEREEAEDKRAREKREQAEKDKKAQAEKDRQERAKAQQEAERKAELEARQKAQQQAQQAKAAEQKKLQAEAAQRDKVRQEQMQRMQAQLGGTGAPDSGGTATRSSGPSASYGGRIKARIKPNIVLTEDVPGNPTAEVEVRVAVDGTITGRRIVKSSGSTAWDEAVLRAIDRTGTLPRDVDGRVQPVLVIAFKPLE